MYVNMCIRVCVCVSVFMCMHVCLCYVLSFASNSCEPLPPLTLFFSVLCSFLLSLSPAHLRFVEFSPPEQQQQPQPRRIFSLAATVDSSAWCTFFCQAPLSLCLHIRPSIVKHVFYCMCVFVCVYVLYSDLSTYIHRNVCLMPVKWG